MTSSTPDANDRTIVREADLSRSLDREAVCRLVAVYLIRTELEKAEHAIDGASEQILPARYQRELDDPARAYARSTVYLAQIDDAPVGIAVLQRNETGRELKRVWVDPGARGRGVGSALMKAALAQSDLSVRLTVWEWRHDAIGLYCAYGFHVVPSWERRPGLVCMERAATSSNVRG